VRDLNEILAPESLADLYRQNPEPTGFRIRSEGYVFREVYSTYEALERVAQTQFSTWTAEPVYE
jgi:hypothetical protein